VINLDGVTFIDSTGLGALVDGHAAAALGIGYEIGPAATPAVARVLAVTGLDNALTVKPAADERTGHRHLEVTPPDAPR
jgi:anti-anti-sigma factor